MQNSGNNFSSLKLHILELLYSSIINKAFDNALEYITKIILNSDSFFNKIRTEYSLISKLVLASTNFILILKKNSTFGEFVLNFIKISTNRGDILNHKSSKYKIYLLLLIDYIFPILLELIPKAFIFFKFSEIFPQKITKIFTKVIKAIKLAKVLLDLGYKLKFIFDKNFLFFDFTSHLLNIMTVNKGSKGVLSEKFLNIGRQLNLFFLFMFVRLGEWYYKKEINEENAVEIEAPERITDVSNSACPICNCRLEKSLVALKCCGCVYCEECIRKRIEETGKCFVCHNLIDERDLVKIFN